MLVNIPHLANVEQTHLGRREQVNEEEVKREK